MYPYYISRTLRVRACRIRRDLAGCPPRASRQMSCPIEYQVGAAENCRLPPFCPPFASKSSTFQFPVSSGPAEGREVRSPSAADVRDIYLMERFSPLRGVPFQGGNGSRYSVVSLRVGSGSLTRLSYEPPIAVRAHLSARYRIPCCERCSVI
jgi:hypothetical protein